MNTTRCRHGELTLRLCAVLVAACTSLPVTAQQLEEIIVTAQKREQNLQDVPAALSAYSAEVVKNAGMLNIENISAMTPGLAVSVYNPTTPAPYIRGVGTNSSSVGDDSSVGVFVDEVYAGRAGGYRADMFDIERIEVLRGPQGTLYGRNVAGGAINILTRNPSDKSEGFVEAGVGDHSLYTVKGSLSGPLSDNARGRIAVSTRRRDGVVDNVVSGNELRDEDNQSVRGKLALDLGDRTTLLLAADYSTDDLAGPGARAQLGATDPDEVSLNQDGFTKRDMWGVSARLNAEWGPGTLTSITAWRENDYSFLDDLTGTFFLPIINEADENAQQFSQELRYAVTQDNREYTVGLYLFDEDVDRRETFDSSGFLASPPGSSRPLFDSTNETQSEALFGEATWRFSDAWSLTAGGRYTWDEKDFSNTATTPDLLGFLTEEYAVHADESWSEFTPRVTLDYQLIDGLMLYATWSTGFKAGGFNGLAGSATEASTPFDPEKATNYEAGMKFENTSHRLRLNLSAFSMDYEDLQNFFLSNGVVVTATADADIQGVEAELFATPVEGLDLSVAYGWLDSEYTKFPSNPANEGNTLMRAPEQHGSAAAQYNWSLGGDLAALARIDCSYQSRMFFNVNNAPEAAAPSYSLINARLAISHASGWELALWGKNLGDEDYIVHAFALAGSSFAIYGDPRTWGLNASYAF